jgi:hypothetical protein
MVGFHLLIMKKIKHLLKTFFYDVTQLRKFLLVHFDLLSVNCGDFSPSSLPDGSGC